MEAIEPAKFLNFSQERAELFSCQKFRRISFFIFCSFIFWAFGKMNSDFLAT
jgi:hypothetical protein